jgi:hypothetical protein
MVVSVEVGGGGMVHAHALYYGPRPDVNKLRAGWTFRVGNSPQIDAKYVRKPAKAIREVAKYVVKAASPKQVRTLRGGVGEYLHPELAARVEVAFCGDRLFETFGAWRGKDVASDSEPEASFADHPCAACGAVGAWSSVRLPLGEWFRAAPPDWHPRFTRTGLSPPQHAVEKGKQTQ